MHKSFILIAVIAAVTPAPLLAQATSGGQAPMADGDIRSTDLGGGSLTNQYLQQKTLNNLPGRDANSATGTRVRARPALPSELTVGATVNDKAGVAIAKIEQVDPDGIVISSGLRKIKIPAEAIGRNKAGLLLDMTKAQFDQVVAQANGS